MSEKTKTLRDHISYAGSHCWKSTEHGCKTKDQLLNKKRYAEIAINSFRKKVARKTGRKHEDNYNRENLEFFEAALNHIEEKLKKQGA